VAAAAAVNLRGKINKEKEEDSLIQSHSRVHITIY
jgi:hypothetical protein